jgi:hemolysin III
LTEPLNGFLAPMMGFREPVSGISHAFAAMLAAFGSGVLFAKSEGDKLKQAAMAIYGASMTALFFVSSAYHLVTLPPELLVWFRKADHACVFVLIAGTFTPFYVVAVEGWWRWGNLMLIWTVALVGVGLKASFVEMPDLWSSSLYAGMGWLALIGYAKLAAAISHRAMAWVFMGGVIYTVGAVVDAARWPVPWPGVFGFHETLHVLTVVAAIVHYHVILRYLVPRRR